MKNYYVVYVIDRDTSSSHLKLCFQDSEYSHTTFIPINAGKVITLMPQQHYDYFYVDLLDGKKRINEDQYKVRGSYYLTLLFPMSILAEKNYKLTSDDVHTRIKTVEEEIRTGKRVLK